MSIDIYRGLADIVRRASGSLAFNIIEVGARPVDSDPEPFYSVLDWFPGSRIHAFEVEHDLCEQLNRTARPGVVYHPVALGRAEEERPFYQTAHPMCASLYRPNERLIERYHNMEVAMLRSVGSISTVSLDYFAREHRVGPVDFVKIDVQGAELEIFEGGTSTLRDVVAVISEVEFIPCYEQQPLFGDVCAFLARQGIGFHKFLTLAGRALRPTIVANNPNTATQHMWADAMFLRDTLQAERLGSDQLLKMAILAHIYGSPDVAVFCCMEYDRRHGTGLGRELNTLLSSFSTAQTPEARPDTRQTPISTAGSYPKVGRNDLCPCGSGKKYKKCHGAHA